MLRLYNTLSRSIEDFKPLEPKKVSMYVCGPTVYDVPHIGHARSAYFFDVLRRYLQFKGYEVRFVRNVTDVDDKIIDRARQELGAGGGGRGAGELQVKCKQVSERYLKAYHEALDRLGIQRPDREPKATEHVVPDSLNVEATKKIDASMTGFISQLITHNVAYPAGGDVYFSVRKFPDYGKLSGRLLDELKAGARIEPGEHKEDPLDFALWKAAKPDEPSWNSPWGPGRPGWHIECSAMSTAYLGDAFDIHGGGVDLVFPHHENEIAQAQAINKPFAKYWVHHGLLTVNGEKMSKSLGNYVTVEQVCSWPIDIYILKMFFLGTHYRSPMDYTTENLRAAGARYDGLWAFIRTAQFFDRIFRQEMSGSQEIEFVSEPINKLKQAFEDAMDDDLNTPKALAVLDDLASLGYQWIEQCKDRVGPSEKISPHQQAPLQTDAEEIEIEKLRLQFMLAADTIEEKGEILGLSFPDVILKPEERAMVEEREEARKRKDFQRADQIRKKLAEAGLLIEDTEKGPIVRSQAMRFD